MKHLCRATVNRPGWKRQREGSGDLGPWVVLDRDLGRLVDLLDDEVALPARDDAGDLGVLVTGNDDEAPRIAADLLVGRAGQLDPLQAVQVPALAHETDAEGVALVAEIEVLRHVLDPLVELPEQRLVPSDALLARGHRSILHQFPPARKRKTRHVGLSAERAAAVIPLTAVEYENVRSESRRFVVASGHRTPDDGVLSEDGGSAVVRV